MLTRLNRKGMIHMLQGILANEYAGAACYPQYILLNGMFVYVIYLGVMVWRKKEKQRRFYD